MMTCSLLLFFFPAKNAFLLQDLERITEDKGGIKEKEPFSLCELYDPEVCDY